MPYTVVRPFYYSTTGLNALHAAKGDMPEDVPADAIPSLVAEKYLVEVKDGSPAPENKAMQAAPENKTEGRSTLSLKK